MAFYFDSTPVAIAASSLLAYLAPLYLISQGILGLEIVRLAAVSRAGKIGN